MPVLQTVDPNQMDIVNGMPTLRPNGIWKALSGQENSNHCSEGKDSQLVGALFWNGQLSAKTKCQKEGEELASKFSESVSETKRLLSQTEHIRNCINHLLEAKDFLFITPVADIKSNVKYQNYCTGAQYSSPPERFGDGLEIVNVVSTAKPNLPPAGAVKRQPLTVGTKVWVMKTNLRERFTKAIIVSILNGPEGVMYRIKCEESNILSTKLFLSKQLAYRTTPDVILPVGTRIIAQYLNFGSFAGVIGEPPNSTNKQRYLVFFDDGCVSYVSYLEVYLMCAQSTDVANDVHETVSNFIRDYLLKYPERALVRLQKDQVTKTELESKWCLSKVLEVDASMVHMKFLETGRTEWIFRGSIRIELLYKELKSAQEHCLVRSHRKHNIVPRRPDLPYVEYTVESESDSEQKVKGDSDESDKSENCEPVDEQKKFKNTARKSTSMKPRKPEIGSDHRGRRNPDMKSHRGFKELHNLVNFSRTNYTDHECSYLCRETMDPMLFKGKNPFLIPIYLGWERQLRKYHKGGQKVIVIYRAPCGRHLRNLKEVYNYLLQVSSKITIDFFSDDSNLVAFRTFRPREIFFLNEDVTQGRENVPICCINSWSNEKPPYVEYASKRFPGEGVKINLDKEFLIGCSCTDNCQNSDRCECRQITNYAYSGSYHGDVGYKFRRLKEPVLTGVFECNSRCRCGPQCGNRVVQFGIQVRLQMFKTENKGWGIRCLDDLDAGMFICIYAGQILTDEGADAGGNQFGDEYLAELDHIEIAERNKEGYEAEVMDIEAELSNTSTFKESDSEEYSKNSDSEESEGSHSDFESTLRNTSVTNYTTRSRKRKRKKTLNSTSSEKYEPVDKLSKILPDLSTPLDSLPIVPRPLSPDSELYVNKMELKRIPNLPDYGKQYTAKNSHSSKNQRSTEFLFNTPHKYKSIRSYFGKGGDKVFIMDAKTKGNIGRYLNHSCVPNVFVQNVFVETHDLRFPEVAFFAYHFIQAGTELTWDYNYEVGSVQNKKLYCYCDAVNCRGRLL